jgi:hypothetical protein
MEQPEVILLSGSEILGSVLSPHHFTFEFRSAGTGSGGDFAWGEFVRTDRRLELHFRRSLGLVAYHLGRLHATHEVYMRELGFWGRNRYPAYSGEPMQGFINLSHDLGHAIDFLSGDAGCLRTAALKQMHSDEETMAESMSNAVGDTRAVARMRDLFYAGRYPEVLSLFSQLKYPERLSKAQRTLVDLARHRDGQ